MVFTILKVINMVSQALRGKKREACVFKDHATSNQLFTI